MLKEYHSRHLDVPYIYIKEGGKYLCKNGVMFTKEEYLKGINLKAEYTLRAALGELYDYDYAKQTGVLRPLPKKEVAPSVVTPEPVAVKPVTAAEQETVAKPVLALCLALAATSIGCMCISTLHTATYLLDYADTFSSWLMSAVITIYCSCAFEVVLLFLDRQRKLLAAIFAFLWLLVLLFSMATTVSVFYDRYNKSLVEAQAEGKTDDSARLKLQMLQKKEAALREDIAFKRRDIEYRQEKDYATAQVRVELERLQSALQATLSEMEKVVFETPVAALDASKATKREGVFAFLARITGVDGGLLEFIMSALSAVFINLISPLSVSVVVSLTGGMKNEGYNKR